MKIENLFLDVHLVFFSMFILFRALGSKVGALNISIGIIINKRLHLKKSVLGKRKD